MKKALIKQYGQQVIAYDCTTVIKPLLINHNDGERILFFDQVTGKYHLAAIEGAAQLFIKHQGATYILRSFHPTGTDHEPRTTLGEFLNKKPN